MDPLTRWETAAIRQRGGRPRPGTGEPTIDLRDSRPAAASPPQIPPEPDTLLVPLDAWNRMLNQLGNLHEAGRDLADARERAARAETEAEFLRERITELRDRLATVEEDRAHDDEEARPTHRADSLAARSRALWKSASAGWRSRLRS